jgi:hypothetical protein
MLISWVVTPCSFVGGHQLSFEHYVPDFVEDGGGMFLRNVGIHIQKYTVYNEELTLLFKYY